MPLPSTRDIFAPGGRLDQLLTGYEYREEQLEAAEAIDEALETARHSLVEAGTGVGKSLAYLLPMARAISAGRRVVVSTYTIGLQTQLIEKDIPLLAALVPEIDLKPVLMKGRGNYLCLQDLEHAEADLLHVAEPLFKQLQKWAKSTTTGDVADLSFTYPRWFEVGSSPDTCRGRDCRYYDRCHYFKMRRQAAESNLVVVNHALYLTDALVRASDTDTDLIPEHDCAVFDEAHHLEDVATSTFGIELDNWRLPQFAERLRRFRDAEIDHDRLAAIETKNLELFEAFADAKQEFFLDEVLDHEARASVELNATQTLALIEGTQTELIGLAKEADDPIRKERLESFARIAAGLREQLQAVVFGADPGYIHWGTCQRTPRETRRRRSDRRSSLAYTPVTVASLLARLVWAPLKTAVLTSATLATSGGFAYIRQRLGVPEGTIDRVIGSPFDFRTQALLYVPAELPAPQPSPTEHYIESVSGAITRLVRLTQGRAFLLFTSRRMLDEVYLRLVAQTELPLFRQGDLPPGKLLQAFRDSGNGVLFGNQTFWEGVDIQGDALSMVVIDRIPFAVPDSPVTKSRCDAVADAGGDPFADLSIPQAQIRLKQGFGRLIRTRLDRGIVCILDSRLIHKRYGRTFIEYLPPAARASLWPRVEAFWAATSQGDPSDSDTHYSSDESE